MLPLLLLQGVQNFLLKSIWLLRVNLRANSHAK